MMTRRLQLLCCGALLAIGAIALSVSAQEAAPSGAAASVINADGDSIGTVTFTAVNGQTVVTAELLGLPQGFHGFHVHTTGSCEDTNQGRFTAAGGHVGANTTSHASHPADLPSLYVTENGSAYLSVVTDLFTVDQILDADGSAIMIHANPDNFANIPPRYGGPDLETLNTGDSGARIACGVIVGALNAEATPEATPAS
ncbi:MAG: superoxide dismutase family protein [Chloroflexota bacterium]|nr:superoxide dismutase family protein [Chloroflexota bacterium]